MPPPRVLKCSQNSYLPFEFVRCVVLLAWDSPWATVACDRKGRAQTTSLLRIYLVAKPTSRRLVTTVTLLLSSADAVGVVLFVTF